MEDILALVMVVVGAWAVYYACKLLWNKYQAHKTKKEIERVAEERRQIEATRKWRESRYQKQQVVGNGMAIQAGGNVSVGISSSRSSTRVNSPTHTPSVTESVRSYNTSSSNDNFLSDLADIAIIANTVHHWNDNSSSHSRKTEDDTPVTSSSSSSSWGFDDSDSRRSAASSFSSSDSSSSWSSSSSDSSSSWSSSDSGPSSDW